jgi:transcription elongation factor Elf1
MPEPTKFYCPTCETPYKVVRIEAAPTANDKQLLCLSCGAPLHNREGKYALKYFKTDGSSAARLNGRRPKLI